MSSEQNLTDLLSDHPPVEEFSDFGKTRLDLTASAVIKVKELYFVNKYAPNFPFFFFYILDKSLNIYSNHEIGIIRKAFFQFCSFCEGCFGSWGTFIKRKQTQSPVNP